MLIYGCSKSRTTFQVARSCKTGDWQGARGGDERHLVLDEHHETVATRDATQVSSNT